MPNSAQNILILHHTPVAALQASRAYLDSLQKYLNGSVTLLDCYQQDVTNLVDINHFDVIIIHYSIIIILDSYLTPNSRRAISDYKGVKVLIIQDEYRWINYTTSCMQYLDFDLLLTCMPSPYIEAVYPEKLFPNLKKVNALTGYTYDDLSNIPLQPYELRDIDVGYRAHKLSAWYGRLGKEKWEISESFKDHAYGLNLKLDISYRSEDRIYGSKWLEFLSSCKCALGSESGASVFDFDDSIRQNVIKYEHQFPNAIFEEIEEKFFKNLDGKIRQNQISPRIFEYAACHNLMILYEGEYSGIIQPDVHYLSLKKDMSNFREIIKLAQDKTTWQRLTDNAYRDLILSEKYHYKNFVAELNAHISNLITTKHFIRPQQTIIAKQSKYMNLTQRKIYLLALNLSSRLPNSLVKQLKSLRNFTRNFMNDLKTFYKFGINDVVCFKREEHKATGYNKSLLLGKICKICRWGVHGYNVVE